MRWLARLLDAATRYRLLERVTLAYLLTPFGIFLLGWLRPLFALPIAAVVAAGFYSAQRRLPSGQPEEGAGDRGGPRVALSYALLLAVVAVVALYSGSGGYSIQDSDHLRANAFLLDLAEFSWPLAYAHSGADDGPGILAFYIGSALPAALAGALFGLDAAFHASFLWTALGLALAVLWFARVSGWTSPWIGLLFLFFGGMDLVAQGVTTGSWAVGHGDAELDIWIAEYASQNRDLMGGMFWIFPSNLTMLFVGPHHVLATWPSLFMILDDMMRHGTCRRAGILAAPVLLWSAFGFVGIAPFLLVVLAVTRGRGFASFENLVVGPLILLVLGLYLLSNAADYIRGPLWEFQDPIRVAPLLALVCLLEFGLYALLCPPGRRRGARGLQPLFWLVLCLCLVAAPWYRMGIFCDFPAKFTIVPLAVLQVWIAQSVAPAGRPVFGVRTWLLASLLAVGSLSGLGSLTHAMAEGLTFAPVRREAVIHANQIAPKKLGPQLFADESAFFWRVLARPVDYADAPTAVRYFRQHVRGLPRTPDSAEERRRILRMQRGFDQPTR